MTDGNKIEGAPTVAHSGASLLPTAHQDKVVREYIAIAKLLEEATDLTQGLKSRPDQMWEYVVTLHDKFKEWLNDDSIIDVPAVVRGKGSSGNAIRTDPVRVWEILRRSRRVTFVLLYARSRGA